eukprot:m.176345 g.176345  ORF g.176345 m.176345 type:complete len:424 (-) comp9959_c0_seq19:118-1389(-)
MTAGVVTIQVGSRDLSMGKEPIGPYKLHEKALLSGMLLLIALALLGPARAAGDGFRLVLVSNETATRTGAACLDGSLPGFYYRPGVGALAHKWRVHLRGGGWCFSAADCLARSKTELGTSTVWPARIEDTTNSPFGLMTNESTVNPVMANWSTVFVPYCDGTSYTSKRASPLLVSGQSLWFRGRQNLDALFVTLQGLGLNQADTVILTGTSAGGLATYLHADHVRAYVPQAAQYYAVPDAGLFLNHTNMAGRYAYGEQFQNAYGPNLWDSAGGIPEACLAAHPTDGYKCLIAATAVQYSRTRPFVVNSMADTYQIGAILGLGCDPSRSGSCSTTQLRALQAYRQDMIDTATAIKQYTSGWFLTSCLQHEETCTDRDWAGIDVAGTPMQTAFYHLLSGQSSYLTDGPYPSNPTCAPPGTRHGSC